MHINWVKVADVLERTVGTFWQAALAVIIVTGFSQTALLVAATAGAMSAAKYITVQLNLWLGTKGDTQGLPPGTVTKTSVLSQTEEKADD